MTARIARLLNYRTLASGQSNSASGQPTVARFASTLLDREVAEIAIESLRAMSLPPAPAALAGWVENAWRYARSSTIDGRDHAILASRSLTN
jgi:hypothetical protein